MVRLFCRKSKIPDANSQKNPRGFLSPLGGKQSISEIVHRCPLSLSFKLVHTSPVSVVLAVNVTQPCHVWCDAWTIGSPINVHELVKESSGKYMQCRFSALSVRSSNGSLRHFKPQAVDDVCNHLYSAERF